MKIYLAGIAAIIAANFHKLFKGDLSASLEDVKEESKFEPLKLNLQFFAEKEEEDEDEDEDEDDDEEGDEEIDYEKLKKNPAFRKAQKADFDARLDKRFKKYKDVDPEEFRRLKAAADKGNKNNSEEDDPKGNRDQDKLVQRAERREKRAIVKEFAVDNSYDPKLLSRLIDLDSIELDEDGNPENLDELFEELEEEFPNYFAQTSEDEDEDEEDSKKKKKKPSTNYTPGGRQKINKQKKVDPKEAGKQRALARHKKKED